MTATKEQLQKHPVRYAYTAIFLLEEYDNANGESEILEHNVYSADTKAVILPVGLQLETAKLYWLGLQEQDNGSGTQLAKVIAGPIDPVLMETLVYKA